MAMMIIMLNIDYYDDKGMNKNNGNTYNHVIAQLKTTKSVIIIRILIKTMTKEKHI